MHVIVVSRNNNPIVSDVTKNLGVFPSLGEARAWIKRQNDYHRSVGATEMECDLQVWEENTNLTLIELA